MIVHVEHRAEVPGYGRLSRLKVRVCEVCAGRDAELAEESAGGHTRDRYRGVGEIQALIQLRLPKHDVETAPDRELRRNLIGHGGLDVQRLENVVVAAKPPVERQWPVGLEAVGSEYPDSDAQLGRHAVGHVGLRHREQRVVEIGLVLEDVIGEAALHIEQGRPHRHAPTLEAGEPSRVEEHGGAVGAGGGHSCPGTPHGARALLVDPEALRAQQGGEGGEHEQRIPRRPPHTYDSRMALGQVVESAGIG